MASAFSLNRVTLIGNVGSDPEIRTTPNGIQVCNFSLATTSSYKDQTGNWQDKTEWHRIVLWAKLAERAVLYLKKGSKTYIEGSIETKSYEKDGIKRYTTEVRGDNFINMEKTEGTGGNSNEYTQQSPTPNIQETPVVDSQLKDDVPF